MNPVELETLLAVREALIAAPRGRKAAVSTAAAASLGWSVRTLYRQLEAAGFDNGRKRRTDAGRSKVTDAELKILSGTVAASANKKGQGMPLTTAVSMLSAGGHLPSGMSTSTLARQLYARSMHPTEMALGTASVELSSDHPNHVWQVDSTTGSYYYLPQGRMKWMPEEQFNKNKGHNLVKAFPDLLTRYAAADHTSHAFKCRYYLGGETAENLLDFVTWAMWKQDGSPMHGVPKMLMMDPGAANKGTKMRRFCKNVGIELRHHAAGAARVTGSVEKVHDLVRMGFETRLRFVNSELVTLDWLNEQVSAWTEYYCANAMHRRHRQTRYGAWMRIRTDLGQLRVAASLEVLREAAHQEQEERRVANDLTISFGRPSRRYRLDGVPGIHAGGKAQVLQNVFRAPSIDVRVLDRETGEETWQVVDPIETNEWGYDVAAVKIGSEMRRAANSVIDEHRNAALKDAYRRPDEALPTLEEAEKARGQRAQAYAGVVDPMADVKATPVPTFLPRRGTPLEAPARTVVARVLSVVEACKHLHSRLGDDYGAHVYVQISGRFPNGVPEDQLEQLAADLKPKQGSSDAGAAAWPQRAAGGAS